MAKSSDSYQIWYEGYRDLASELANIGEKIDGLSGQITGARNMVMDYHAVYHQLGKSVGENLFKAAGACAWLESRLGSNGLPRVMGLIAITAEEHEKAARGAWHRWGANGAERTPFDTDGIANGFYADAAAAAAAAEEAQRAAEEAEQKRLQEEAERKAKEAEMLALLGAISPTAALEYNDRLTEAQYQDLMEYFKDDPVMLEKIKKDYEAWKKACEERDKILAEGGTLEEALGLDGSGFGGGLGEDLGLGGFDGESDLDLGGFGGGGGGFGSDDWASSDWASDLLDEGLDTDGFLDADGALEDILGSGLDDPLSVGLDAAGDAADVGETGVFGQYGEQLASMVQAYGLQAALAIGGGVALYATRETTIEAAAHVAEFVSTKCKPAVGDVLEQMRGMAKKTRVNLGRATSNVKAAARGEEAGDLVG